MSTYITLLHCPCGEVYEEGEAPHCWECEKPLWAMPAVKTRVPDLSEYGDIPAAAVPDPVPQHVIDAILAGQEADW